MELLRRRPAVPVDVTALQQRLAQSEREKLAAEEKLEDTYQQKLALDASLKNKDSEQYDYQTSSTRNLTHNYGSMGAYQKLLHTSRSKEDELNRVQERLAHTQR